jgi:hypothetical protein
VKRDSAIEAWFREQPAELGSIAQKWFARMRQCGGDVRELLHDGCPVACVADVPFAYVNVFRRHVNVGFFHRAALADRAGLLEATGKNMRHVKLKPGRSCSATTRTRKWCGAGIGPSARRVTGGGWCAPGPARRAAAAARGSRQEGFFPQFYADAQDT